MAAENDLLLSFQQALAGRFSIERELGRGGMGIVFLARDVQLDRRVAIKLLPPGLSDDQSTRDRFLSEARAAARLTHPNIVPIHLVDDVDGFAFFVMTYVEGMTLGEYVRNNGAMSAEDALPLLRDMAYALDHAHSRGVVHRDIKPDNIILERGSNRPVILDFGIAHLEGTSSDTPTGSIVGTVDYMSPEQANGASVDARSDLFSLGLVARFMLTGENPRKTGVALIAERGAIQEPSVRESLPHLPRDLARGIDSCLRLEVESRPESGGALAERFNRAFEMEARVPEPVRHYLKVSERWASGRFFATSLIGGMTIATILSLFLDPIFSAPSFLHELVEYLVYAAVLTGAPVASVGQEIRQLRDLFKSGHSESDLIEAVRRRKQELIREVERSGKKVRRVVDQALHSSWKVTTLLSTGTIYGVATGSGLFSEIMNAVPALSIGALLFSVLGAGPAWRAGARIGAQEKFRKSRLGKLLSRLARFGLKKTDSQGQRTEIIIGQEVEEAFEALPPALKAEIGDLPSLVESLEKCAGELRSQISDLDDQFERVRATSSPVAEKSAQLLEELGKKRDRARNALKDVVAALEILKLDIVRLRIGSQTVEGIDSNISRAREVSDHADRLIGARSEVEEILKGRERTG